MAKKKEGAKLNEVQKLQLKKDIMATFPNLSMFESEIEFLIEEYSERNKNIAKEIAERGEKWLIDRGHELEKEESKGEIRNLGPGDEGYDEVLEKFRKAQVQEEERMKKIEELALKEMEQKQISNIKINV